MRLDSLQEAKYYQPLEKIDTKAVYSKIVTECSDIVKLYRLLKRQFWRGVKMRPALMVYYAAGRSDNAIRNPKDSALAAQTIYDNALKLLGAKALRNNSTFMSPSVQQASYYGKDLFTIYPVNGFHYTWNTRIGDTLLHNLGSISNDHALLYMDVMDRVRGSEIWIQDHDDKAFKFYSSDLMNVIDEIKLHGRAELAFAAWAKLKAAYPSLERYDRERRITPKMKAYFDRLHNTSQIAADLKPMLKIDRDLDQVLMIDRKMEVYFSGAYYAVHQDNVELNNLIMELT